MPTVQPAVEPTRLFPRVATVPEQSGEGPVTSVFPHKSTSTSANEAPAYSSPPPLPSPAVPDELLPVIVTLVGLTESLSFRPPLPARRRRSG